MTFNEFNKTVKMNYVAHVTNSKEYISIYKSTDSRFGMHVIVRRLDNFRMGKERIHWLIGNKTYYTKESFERALQMIPLSETN